MSRNDSALSGIHSRPRDRLHIFAVGGPFWGSYSKAPHGASKASLVRTAETGHTLLTVPSSKVAQTAWETREMTLPETTWAPLLIYSRLLTGGCFFVRGDQEWGWHLQAWLYTYYLPWVILNKRLKLYECFWKEVKWKNIKHQEPGKGKPK